MSICPPEELSLQDGGSYVPSPMQLKIWKCWRFFWDEWVPTVCRGEPFAVAFNGDAIDGIHHNSVTQISHNLVDQLNLAYIMLKPVVDACEGRFYFIRGTEAHVGQSGQNEEELARRLKAVKDDQGQYSRYELRIRIGKALVHLSHHIGIAGSLAYETSAIQKELEQLFVECARWGHEIPDVVVRSHRHRNAETRVRIKKHGRYGFATSCTTAAWQLKTPFAYRVAGARIASPQIGGTVVRFGDEDTYTRHCIWSVDQTKIEEPLL